MATKIRTLGIYCAGLLAVGLCGCMTVPTTPVADALLKDALFKPLQQPIAAETVFAMTPEMQRYADTELAALMRSDSAERALIDALYSKGRLQLEYDASSTRNAAGAFAARTGNCLSLVIMTGAFAEYFGLNVRYQEVYAKQTWSRSGLLEMANRHVNMRFVSRSDAMQFTMAHGSDDDSELGMTVDFVPSKQAERYRSRPISRETVIAMFMNNRAAEWLAEGNADEAYWWVRAAIQRVPSFMDSYNTLGVVYQQHGDLPQAEHTFLQALVAEPENTIAMSNLVMVLQAQGKAAEAQQLQARMARIEPLPPFHFYDLGVAALQAQDFAKAQDFFQREINRNAEHADSHFGLAIAELQLGEPRKAKNQLNQALDLSTTSHARMLYSAKLDWLKSQGYVAPLARTPLPRARSGR